MAWSYSGNPASSSKDAIRFLIGDTRSDDSLVQDEEIAWALTQHSSIYAAAALVAESIASYFATQATSVIIGPIREDYGQRAKDYTAKAKDLRNKATERGTINFFCGGISVSDKETSEADTDLVQPIFKKEMDDIVSFEDSE